ncbi:hypothetical protein WCLP8_4900004 [uncultured Gammaproteobacteria bacterium]
MTNNPWFVLRSQLEVGVPGGASPDIILGGPKSDPNYSEQYDTAFNRTGKFGSSNFVYVRAKNTDTDTAPGVGSVSVFATRLGSLQNQSQWVKLRTSDGRESTNISAGPGKVGVNGTPLIWEAGETPPAEAPWCLIAEIVGDNHPLITVPETVKDKKSFDAWIATQTRMAYVIVQTPAVVPVQAPTFGWQQVVNLANNAETTLDISLTCTKGTAGGFLSYVFDKNDSSGQEIGVGKTQYQINTPYSQGRKVPAGFNSTVSIAYTPAADEDAEAVFVFQVATESGDGDDGGLGTTTTTVVVNYTLSFGQVRGAA